jgi:hypothetical protein
MGLWGKLLHLEVTFHGLAHNSRISDIGVGVAARCRSKRLNNADCIASDSRKEEDIDWSIQVGYLGNEEGKRFWSSFGDVRIAFHQSIPLRW